jgi:hypothetical protein
MSTPFASNSIAQNTNPVLLIIPEHIPQPGCVGAVAAKRYI